MNERSGEAQVVVAFTTAPTEDAARKIARRLVEEGLAACVSRVSGVTSVYRWLGAVQEDSEVLLVIKTTRARVGDLMNRLPAVHPYEVPEFVALDASAVTAPYAAWVRSVTG